MQEDIRLIDLVIELLDARAVQASRNPDIDTLANGKARLVLLNKADLADERENEKWAEWFSGQGITAALIDARGQKSSRSIAPLIETACREKIERDRRRGIKNRPVRAMVVGIPNVGKSTLINSMAGKGVAKTGNKPGVTKGKQWIRLNKQVELLDTPGILWPKFEDQEIGKKLALIGSIRDEVTDPRELAVYLGQFLAAFYPGALHERYELTPEDTEAFSEVGGERLLIKIAEIRSALKKGGEPDQDKAALLFLSDFRSGKLGRISLDRISKGVL